MAADLPTDDARRALALEIAQIADRVERSRCGLGVNERHVIDLGLTVAENLPTILASLRAKTAGGAEEMRERAAALCDEEARDQHNLAVAALSSDTQASDTAYGAEEAARTLASAIRSLPLDPSPHGEGGGA